MVLNHKLNFSRFSRRLILCRDLLHYHCKGYYRMQKFRIIIFASVDDSGTNNKHMIVGKCPANAVGPCLTATNQNAQCVSTATREKDLYVVQKTKNFKHL